MGHLFSRAIRRLTLVAGGGGASEGAAGSPGATSKHDATGQQAQQASQREEQDPQRPTVQAIPVGQSIDSAEYAAFENASSTLPKQRETSPSRGAVAAAATAAEQQVDVQTDKVEESRGAEKENSKQGEPNADEPSNPAVEEAAIKIQALVRGHLTRKALKDAQQQAASVAPNALGQSQFDEESLTKNPPSAVFSPSSPLNLSTSECEPAHTSNTQQQASKHANSRVPPLESIAEDVETAPTGTATDQTQVEQGQAEKTREEEQTEGQEPAGVQPQTPSTPACGSEATASIDINCDTPASASIDILDHQGARPNFALASVLHLNQRECSSAGEQPGQVAAEDSGHEDEGEELQEAAGRDDDDESLNVLPDISGMPSTLISSSAPGPFGSGGGGNHHGPRSVLNSQREQASAGLATALTSTASSLPTTPPHIRLAATSNSHSIDSAEAAAIRIQSAFRGYHTRKHSPYRRRSPGAAANSAPASSPPGEPTMNGHSRNVNNLLANNRLHGASLLGADDDDDDEDDEHADEEEENHNANELESDDIERRAPRGRRVSSEERAKQHQNVQQQQQQPQIRTEEIADQEPALVSDSSSFERDESPGRAPRAAGNEHENPQQRLEVVSPDEAIESGRSSPALVSSNNSSDEGEHDEGEGEAGGEPSRGQQAGGGSRNRKKNRNKRRGKK